MGRLRRWAPSTLCQILGAFFFVVGCWGCEPPTVDRVIVDVTPFQDGCTRDGECDAVTENACDFCSCQRDRAILGSAPGYTEAIAEAAESCTNDRLREGELCPRCERLIEAVCVDGRCTEAPP